MNSDGLTRAEMRKFECYTMWRHMGLKRRITQGLANAFGVTVQTLYKWQKKPVVMPDGTKYDNWEDAYFAETRAQRENIEKEIQEQINNGQKLDDLIAEKLKIKMLMKIEQADYEVKIDDLVKFLYYIEKRNERLDNIAADKNANSATVIRTSRVYRSDKVGDSVDT